MDVSEKYKEKAQKVFQIPVFQQRMEGVGWKHPGFRQEIQFRTRAAWLNMKSRLCRNAARYAAKDACRNGGNRGGTAGKLVPV